MPSSVPVPTPAKWGWDSLNLISNNHPPTHPRQVGKWKCSVILYTWMETEDEEVCSCLVHSFSLVDYDLFITCSQLFIISAWFLYNLIMIVCVLFMICSRHVYELLMTYPWLLHELFMSCSCLDHNLLMTSSLVFHDLDLDLDLLYFCNNRCYKNWSKKHKLSYHGTSPLYINKHITQHRNISIKSSLFLFIWAMSKFKPHLDCMNLSLLQTHFLCLFLGD